MAQALALLIEGLPDPQGLDSEDVPVLFVEGYVDSVAAVSDLAAFANISLRSWIPVRKESIGGFTWGATPRDPFGKPTPISVQIADKDDLLGALFKEDFDSVTTLSYKLQDTRVTRAQTAFRVNGPGGLAAPTVDRYLWIREEAVFVTAVAAVAGTDDTWDITVARAQCGSRAFAHQLRPRDYPPISEGLDVGLYFQTRPDWDHQYFSCRLYNFDVTGSTVTAVRTKTFGYVSQRPRPNGWGWSLVIEPDEKRMLTHKFAGKPEVTLSRCVRVTEASSGSSYGPSTGTSSTTPSTSQIALPPGLHPRYAHLYLTRLEAEFLFDETLHLLEENYLSLGTFVTRMTPGMTGQIPWQYAICLEVGGWMGLLAISSLTLYIPSDAEPMLHAGLSLVEAWSGSIGDIPVEAINDADFTDDRPAGLNAGMTNRINETLRPEEAPPKASLWLISQGVSQCEAMLYLYLSGDGDGANDATYDKLACKFGFDGDINRLNKGTAPGTVITTDPGTSELLKLNALIPEKLEYRLKAGEKWEGWLINESLRSMCLWVPEPSTGQTGWRQMDRPGPTSVTTVNPVKSPKYQVEPGQRLPAVEAIRFETGYFGKDNACQDWRLLRLAETDSYRDGEKLPSEITIRYWKRGNFFTSSALNSGPLPRLSNFYFRQLKAAPSVFKVPTSLLRGPVKVGDFLSWTDDNIQTASGRGVSNLTCLVIAQDTDNQSGPQWVLLLPYALPVTRTATGKIAPALKILESEVVSSTRWDVYCVAVGDPTVDLTTAYNGLFPAILSVNGRLRVVTPSSHNPLLANERPGWLEASATLIALSSSGGIHCLRLNIATQWQRGGAVDIRRDLLKNDQAYILLSDRRPASANPANVEIVPPAAQRKGAVGNVLDAIHLAPLAPQQPFDGYYYLFS